MSVNGDRSACMGESVSYTADAQIGYEKTGPPKF